MKSGGALSVPQRRELDLDAPLRIGDGNRRAGKGRELKKKRERRAVRGVEGPLRLRIPGSIFYPSPPLPIIVNQF